MSTYSTNLALELITTGTQSGTWGDTTNVNIGTLIEQAVSGYVTQAITDGADTVITIPNGATGVARNMFLELTGTLAAARTLLVPANKKLYFIYNNTSGGYAVTVKVSGQTGISVPNGKKMVLVSNGTDIVDATSYMNALTVGGTLLQIAHFETKAVISASNIDLTTGNYFSKTISGTTTFTVSNVPATNTASSFILDLTNGGSSTVTWWSNVKWQSGTAPALTTSGRDILGFFTYDNGTTWNGFVMGRNMS